MTRTAALVLALLLPLSACSDPAPDVDGAPAPGATPSVVVVPTAPPTALATTAAGATLVLRGDGIALENGGNAVPIPFGTGTSVVVPALAAALGTEPEQRPVPCSQGQRTAVGANGFDLLFDGDRFVGWDDSTGSFVTDAGLKVGAARSDVRRTVPQAQFSQSDNGTVFTSPSGLGGFLDSDSESATVVGLTGGETCVA